MMSKKTLVVGASPHRERYSYLAVQRLLNAGHETIALGKTPGEIHGLPIVTGKPEVPAVHTITMYLSPEHQAGMQDYLLALKPKRIIFNPGAENAVLAREAQQRGIEVVYACTLVLLSTGEY